MQKLELLLWIIWVLKTQKLNTNYQQNPRLV